MKRHWLLTALGAILAGAGLHFLWQALPNPLFALISPVNESVWEHLKLFFWPVLAAAFVMTRGSADGQRAWSGWLLAELAMPLFCAGGFYLLSCGFGVEALWVDLTLYMLTLAAGFRLAYRKAVCGDAAWAAGVLVIAVGLYGAALILFTLAPPLLPIFQG